VSLQIFSIYSINFDTLLFSPSCSIFAFRSVHSDVHVLVSSLSSFSSNSLKYFSIFSSISLSFFVSAALLSFLKSAMVLKSGASFLSDVFHFFILLQCLFIYDYQINALSQVFLGTINLGTCTERSDLLFHEAYDAFYHKLRCQFGFYSLHDIY